MGKKNRRKKTTVYVSYEGDREERFLNFLIQLYKPDLNNINITTGYRSGGTADRIVSLALKNNDRDKVFAWCDEDFEPDYPLSQETKEDLAKWWSILENDMPAFFSNRLKNLQHSFNQKNRKPILIISQPVCVEGFILKILNKNIPYKEYNHLERDKQIKGLKNALENHIKNSGTETELYKQTLTIEFLEERKEIPELDLLLSVVRNG